MPRFHIEVDVECETLEQAEQVAAERLGHDEDYGFEYQFGETLVTEGVGTPTPQNFYLTFGMKYRTETHPYWAGAHPDSWVRIIADDEDAARDVAHSHFGNAYAFIYEEQRFNQRWHPKGEAAVLVQDRNGAPVRQFTSSSPEWYGHEHREVVAVRVEGYRKENSDTDAIENLGYEVEYFHRKCAAEGMGLFAEIQDVDMNVLAFELDWSQPYECPVCEESIT